MKLKLNYYNRNNIIRKTYFILLWSSYNWTFIFDKGIKLDNSHFSFFRYKDDIMQYSYLGMAVAAGNFLHPSR
jgi:hypothetical protein